MREDLKKGKEGEEKHKPNSLKKMGGVKLRGNRRKPKAR